MITALPPIFAGLGPDDQIQAKNMLRPFRFGPGDTIMGQGEQDASIAFLMSGHADIFVDETKVGHVSRGGMIGEMELYGQCPRLGTIQAASNVDLLVLGPDEYLELCETGNPVVFSIERGALRRVGDRLREMDDAITRLAEGEPFELRPKGKGLLSRINPFARDARPKLDIVDVLKDSSLFGWADATILDELVGSFSTAAYENDQRICRQGEVGEIMYVLAKGEVEVVLQISEKRAEHITTLTPGMAFGESAIIHACPRTATCVAKGHVEVLTMDRDNFMAITDGDTLAASVFRQALIKNLVLQIDKANQRMVALDQNRTEQEEEMLRGTPVSAVWRD